MPARKSPRRPPRPKPWKSCSPCVRTFSFPTSDCRKKTATNSCARYALNAASGGNTFAVALTGYARDQDYKAAMGAGYQEFVAKPVNLEELYSAILRARESGEKRAVNREQRTLRTAVFSIKVECFHT